MKTPLVLAAAALLALCPPAARADLVHFGNFAPGTGFVAPGGGGEGAGEIPVVTPGITSSQYIAVAFTTGAQALEITTLELGLSGNSTGGLQVLLASADLPTESTLLTFSTLQTITDTASRITYTPGAAFTLQPATTYWIRLQWDESPGSATWEFAANNPDILSNYSFYALPYGSYDSRPNQDLGAYYITAVTAVPEAGASALMIAGVAVLAGVAHRVRRRRQKVA